MVVDNLDHCNSEVSRVAKNCYETNTCCCQLVEEYDPFVNYDNFMSRCSKGTSVRHNTATLGINRCTKVRGL